MGSNRSLPNGPRPTSLTRPFLLSSDPDPPHLLPTPLTRPPNCIPAVDGDAALRQCGMAVRQGAGPGGAGPQELGGPHHREVQERRRATAAASCFACCPAWPLQSALLGELRPGAGCGRPAGQLASRPPRSGAQGQGAAYSMIRQRANARNTGSTACAQDHTAPACAQGQGASIHD